MLHAGRKVEFLSDADEFQGFPEGLEMLSNHGAQALGTMGIGAGWNCDSAAICCTSLPAGAMNSRLVTDIGHDHQQGQAEDDGQHDRAAFENQFFPEFILRQNVNEVPGRADERVRITT